VNAGQGVTEERRRHVRVLDAVGLHIQSLVDVAAAGQAVTESELPAIPPADKYAISGYADVRRDYPDIIAYIDNLEERIRQLLLDGDEAPLTPTHKVGLSAGGVSFSEKTLFVPGEVVSITLTLFPSGMRIGTDAVIESANRSQEVGNSDAPTYRAKFLRISDCDRRAIKKHVDQILTRRPAQDDT